MASPQLENGYTQIANEILEQLCYPGINGSEYRVLLLVIRKTYGFKKKKDRISLSQFQQFTLMNRAQAVETIKSLLEKKILLKDEGKFVFNKNYHEWIVCKRIPSMQKHTSTQKHTTASMQKHTESSMQKHTHKRKKETITKETYRKEGALIIKAFEEVDPRNKHYYGNTTQRKACDFLIDEYGIEQVTQVISILPQTNTLQYFPTITTPVQLRDKWVQLQNMVERKRVELTKPKVKVI